MHIGNATQGEEKYYT